MKLLTGEVAPKVEMGYRIIAKKWFMVAAEVAVRSSDYCTYRFLSDNRAKPLVTKMSTICL